MGASLGGVPMFLKTLVHSALRISCTAVMAGFPVLAIAQESPASRAYDVVTVGPTIDGRVADIDVLTADRLVLTLSTDAREAYGLEHAQIVTWDGVPIGEPIDPEEAEIVDIVPAVGGGFWLLSTAPAVVDGENLSCLVLQRFDIDGRPAGNKVVLEDSGEREYLPRRGVIIPVDETTTFVSATWHQTPERQHHMFRVVDGEVYDHEVVDEDLMYVSPAVHTRLTNGNVAVGWERGYSLYLSAIHPGYRTFISDPVSWDLDVDQQIWTSSARRRAGSNLRLASFPETDEVAATFQLENRLAWQRFGPDGVAVSGVQVIEDAEHGFGNRDPGPLWIDEGGLVYLGEYTLRRYPLTGGEPTTLARVDRPLTAFASDGAHGVFAATLVGPSSSDSAGGSAPSSRLVRFRPR